MTKTIGNIIRELRCSRNLTQEQLAENLNITAQAKIAVGVAPSAVMLIERTVFLAADVAVLQRHTAALADQLSR